MMSLNDALYQLYLADQQVRGLASRLEGARRDVRAKQARIEQLQQQRQELDDQLQHARASEANLESEAQDTEQKIEEHRQQMNTAQTNKQYQALLVEVNTLKSDKSKTEERALEMMTQIESLQKRLAEVDEALAEQQKIKQVADQKLEQRKEEVSDQLERAKRDRQAAAEQVPERARAEFERLADSTDGEPMAPVEAEDPRRMEFICGGCFMAIPVERVNQLMTGNELVLCPSCARILYLSQQTKEAMGIRS